MKAYFEWQSRRMFSIAVAGLLAVGALGFAGCEEDDDGDDETNAPAVDFVYVGSGSRGEIQGFYIERDTGMLTEMPGSTFNGYTQSFGNQQLATAPGSQALYVLREGSPTSLGVKRRNASTGALSSVTPGSYEVAISSASGTVAVRPQGDYVYVYETFNGLIVPFEIDSDDQTLTEIANYDPPNFPVNNLMMNASGENLYLLDTGTTSLYSFQIDDDTGEVSPTPGVSVGLGTSPFFAIMDPLGEYVFVHDTGDDEFTILSIDGDGDLDPVASEPYVETTLTNSVFQASGDYFYVLDGGELMGFAMDRDSDTFTPLSGGDPVLTLGSAAFRLASSPDGQYLLAVETQESVIRVFDITAGGIPEEIDGSPFESVITPNSIVTVASEASE